MDRKRIVLAILTSACWVASMLAGTIPSNAQINGFGTSTAGGSGGAPTGPTNFTGIYGSSSAGGSGGVATGPTNFGSQGFGLSTAGGSGGRPTGSTEPILPQFGGTPSSSHSLLSNPGAGAPVRGNVGDEHSVLGPSICVQC
jgi:hypothetical protein